jgi:hypothetical protein
MSKSGFSYKKNAPRWGYKIWVVVAITNIKPLWCCQKIAPEGLNIGQTSK